MVYCRSGKRSAAAAAKLDGNLFKTYNLLGGYLSWTEAGKSVSTYDVEGFKTASGEPLAITLINPLQGPFNTDRPCIRLRQAYGLCDGIS